jgi:hypothetical protein
MKKFIYILFVLFLIFTTSCRSKRGVFYQPTEKEFNLKEDDFEYDKRIDTSSIYLNSRDASGDGVIIHRMMRFSNQGVFYFIRGSVNPITVFDANLANEGSYGRYFLYDDNKIKLEFYTSQYGSFIYWYGTYDSDGIQFNKEGTRNFYDLNTTLGQVKDFNYFEKTQMEIYTELKIPK